METTMPDTAGLISDEQLDDLEPGLLQALIFRLTQKQHDNISSPRAYERFSVHQVDDATDWGTNWTSEDGGTQGSRGKHAGPTPIAPPDFHNTLPGLTDSIAKTQRVADATISMMTQHADRAYSVDRDTLLGIPVGVNVFKNGKRWLASRFQLDARHMTKFYDRAALIAGLPSTIDRAPQPPKLPHMAQAYAAGQVPSENLDRMSRLSQDLHTFYQDVGLPKENADAILRTLDPIFTDAARTMKPQELAAESTKWLQKIAHSVDPDGPAPEQRSQRIKNSLRTKIVNGKLHINIITDVVNLELIEALILAGLNFKANQDKFRPVPEDTEPSAPPPEADTAAETNTTAPTAETPPPEEDATASDDDAPSDAQDAADDGLFDGTEFAADPADDDLADAQQRLKDFHQKMDDAVDDSETFTETPDGHKLSRDELCALDPRRRDEKAHDILITILKAQGKRSPGAEGMAEYKRAPSILWTVMDYETLLAMLGDRIPAQYHLDDQHKRPDGLDGLHHDLPASLDPLQAIVDEHLTDHAADPEAILGADPLLGRLWTAATAHDDDEPPPGTARSRGHPYVAKRFQTGAVSPAAVLQDLCDAKIIPAIFNQAGVPLFLGRGKRLFSDDQILAAGMLGGCRGPGCRVPPVWTDGHHGLYWSHNGGTNTTNLILLCNACHTLVHQGVWTPMWTQDGVLYWIPAPWLDPTQTPIRNTYWD